jgi:hypothetical protein
VAVKRVLQSVALGFVLAIVVVAATDNPSVPDGVRFALSSGLLVAMSVAVNGNVGEQISKFVGITFWVDVAFYSVMAFAVIYWMARRRPKKRTSEALPRP